jgi:hypothetical protein
MLQDNHLTKNSVFAADRRADITVELNGPIAQALGQEAVAIADYLSKAGSAVLHPYPRLSIKFSLGRLIADSDNFIRQFVKLNTIAQSLEIRLFDIMQSASNWLRSFDETAFVTAVVNHKPQDPMINLKPMKCRRT